MCETLAIKRNRAGGDGREDRETFEGDRGISSPEDRRRLERIGVKTFSWVWIGKGTEGLSDKLGFHHDGVRERMA